MKKLSTIDLFSGAGGLSYGFLTTNMFDIKLAIENNKHAQETYLLNHPNTKIAGDINDVDFSKILSEFKNIDVIIGGPPCQGFSNANRQRNYLVSDKNQLIKSFVSAVDIVNPKIVVMENVKTIASKSHKFFCSKNEEQYINSLNVTLSDDDVIIGTNQLNSFDFQEFITTLGNNNLLDYILPSRLYSVLNQLRKQSVDKNKYCDFVEQNYKRILELLPGKATSELLYFCDDYYHLCTSVFNKLSKKQSMLAIENFKNELDIILDINSTLLKLLDIINYGLYYSKIYYSNEKLLVSVKSYNIVDYIEASLKIKGYSVISGKLNAADYGVPQLRERFFLIGIKSELLKNKISFPVKLVPKEKYVTIDEAIKDLECYVANTNLNDEMPIPKKNRETQKTSFQQYVNDTNEIYNHLTTNSSQIALQRFSTLAQGQNFHDLETSLKSTYAEPSRTQNTIYKRLDSSKPSDTVVNVRKSMWIHPKLNRAISIREAARLQSFPDSFIFCGKKDSQYQQIGNAVPPLLGRAIANHIISLIKEESFS